MDVNVEYQPEVDAFPVPAPSSRDPSTDQSETPSDTETLLKSFIKENLHGRYPSTGGTSSSDESCMTELHSPVTSRAEGIMARYGSLTPEPQPLTRSNVTMHDGIWRTGEEEEQEERESQGRVWGGSSFDRTQPISLSPPLKGLRLVSPGGGVVAGSRRPWDQSLSDAESDHSFSSQDTMILRTTTEEAARGHLRYLERYNSGGDASLPLTATSTRGSHPAKRSIQDTNTQGDNRGFDPQGVRRAERGTSPSRRVRFADDVTFEEQEQEQEAAGASAASQGPPHRCLNVDYSRLLGGDGDRDRGGRGRGGGEGREQEDQDDGYESTDNASSTSSSSNGTPNNPQPPPPPDGDPETPQSDNLKTDYGYVDRSKVPSFRRMNLELRRKAMTRSAQMSDKTSVEDKLRALCMDDNDHRDYQEDIKGRDQSSSTPGVVGEGADFEPRDTSSPVPPGPNDFTPRANPGEGSYSIGNLAMIGHGERSESHTNSQGGFNPAPSNPPTTSDRPYDPYPDCSGVAPHPLEGGHPNTSGSSLRRTHSMFTQSTHVYPALPHSDPYPWDTRTPSSSIPDQPRRPAPVLRDRQSSPVRTMLADGVGDANTDGHNMRIPLRTTDSIVDTNNGGDTYTDRQSLRTMSERFYPTHVTDHVTDLRHHVTDLRHHVTDLRHHVTSPQRPVADMYRSQPLLPTSSDPSTAPLPNLGPVSSRFRSEPQLQRTDFYGACADLTGEDAFGGDTDPDLESSVASSMEGSYRVQESYGGDELHQSVYSFGTGNSYGPSSSYGQGNDHVNIPRGTYRPDGSESSFSAEASSHLPHNTYNTQNPYDNAGRIYNPVHPYGPHVSQRPQSAILYTNRAVSPARPASPRQPTQMDRGHNDLEQPQGNNDIPGLFVYRSGTLGTHNATSDEHLNVSGSTGSSNDSGIEQQSTEGSTGSGGVPVTSSIQGGPAHYVPDDRHRREGSPVGRAFNQTPPLYRINPEKEGHNRSLLCQPGQFHTPSVKDLNRMRTQHRASPSGARMQPMKALPLRTEEDWSDKLETTAEKMLNSHGNNIKSEYARYLQLYSKFQRDNKDCHSPGNQELNPDGTVRRSSFPEYGSYGQMPIAGSGQNPHGLSSRTLGHSEPRLTDSTHAGPKPSTTSVRYMRSADILHMLEEQRGPPRLSRSQPTTPTQGTPPDWDTAKQNAGYNQRINNSLDNIQYNSDYDRHTPSPDRGYVHNKDAPLRHSPVNVGVTPLGGSTIHAKNADIYSLYTGTARGRRPQTAAGVGTKGGNHTDSHRSQVPF